MLPYAGARRKSSPQHGKQSIPQARPELRAKPRKHHVQRTRTGRVHGLQSALYLFYSHKCGSNSDCDRRTRVAQQARIAHTRGRGAAHDTGDHSHSHLVIHIHTSSTERQSDHSAFQRSRKIDAEIAISCGDHSHAHLIFHIHTSSTERQSDHSAFRCTVVCTVCCVCGWLLVSARYGSVGIGLLATTRAAKERSPVLAPGP